MRNLIYCTDKHITPMFNSITPHCTMAVLIGLKKIQFHHLHTMSDCSWGSRKPFSVSHPWVEQSFKSERLKSRARTMCPSYPKLFLVTSLLNLAYSTITNSTWFNIEQQSTETQYALFRKDINEASLLLLTCIQIQYQVLSII